MKDSTRREVLTNDEKDEFSVNLMSISDVLSAIDYLSVTQDSDRNEVAMLLHSLPFFSEKLTKISERLFEVSEIEVVQIKK